MTDIAQALAAGCFDSVPAFEGPPETLSTTPGTRAALRTMPSGEHLQRHGTYTHTGYPFMQLAKETGADYGDVLLYAEWLRSGNRFKRDQTSLPVAVRSRIVDLIKLPAHLRGGVHFPPEVVLA